MSDYTLIIKLCRRILKTKIIKSCSHIQPLVYTGPTPSDMSVAVMRVWDNLITQNRKLEEGEVTNHRPSHTLQHMIKSEGANNNKKH